jgi:hypothetical protein
MRDRTGPGRAHSSPHTPPMSGHRPPRRRFLTQSLLLRSDTARRDRDSPLFPLERGRGEGVAGASTHTGQTRLLCPHPALSQGERVKHRARRCAWTPHAHLPRERVVRCKVGQVAGPAGPIRPPLPPGEGWGCRGRFNPCWTGPPHMPSACPLPGGEGVAEIHTVLGQIMVTCAPGQREPAAPRPS